TGHHANEIGLLDLAEAEPLHAGIFLEVAQADDDLLALLDQDVLDRFARQVGDLALEIAHAGFPRVVADQVAQRVGRDRPFALLEAVRLDLFWDQVTLGDLDLLILGVAGDTDDLHAVHQRL